MSTSLAVRHRPRTFADVGGQQHLVAVLKAAARRSPVPQQILIAGPSGVGKTTLARVFAAALFCPHVADGEPCGECEVCRQVTGPGGRHPDVIELDAASHGGIDQIRALGDEAHLAPLLAPWRIYIIDEAHGLTKDGGQAFLRLLEEPPAHTIFVLATTDPQKLPDALRGRCLLCYATPPTRDELVANLARVAAHEQWHLAPGVLEVVVDNTEPALGVRGTVTNLDKVAGGAGARTVTVAEASAVLGAGDPELMAGLTTAVAAGDRGEALRCLLALSTSTGRPALHSQLHSWAHRQLRERVAAGQPVAEPLWYLEVLAEVPAGQLEVAVAKMSDPHLGGVAGLEALCERAEAVAARIAGQSQLVAAAGTAAVAAPATPTPAPALTPTPTPGDPAAPAQPAARARRSRATAAAKPVAAPAQDPPATPAVPAAPAEPAATRAQLVPVGLDDADLLTLMNTVGRHDGRAGLALRRARVHRDGTAWVVHADGVGDPAKFADTLVAAAASHGWTVTVTC